MQKIALGKTGLTVSRLGFGGIPIQRDSEEEAVAVVRRCLDLGVTFLDTANAYTTSEGRIGKAIAGRREGLVLATKSGARSREGVAAHLKQSLKQLGTDYIDIYQFHGVSDAEALARVLAPQGPLALAREAQAAGVIRHIGVTSHSMDIAKQAVQTGEFETVMFPLNFVVREAATELLPLARRHNVAFIAMKPLAGGMLQNASLGVKYLLQFPDILPIVGIEKVHEIEEIAGILQGSWAVSAAEQAEMKRISDELGARFCRRCQYCQPCKQEIPITTVMTSLSFFKRLPPERFFDGATAEAMQKAAACTRCGECEERCPYHLPIRDMLEENLLLYQREKAKYEARSARS